MSLKRSAATASLDMSSKAPTKDKKIKEDTKTPKTNSIFDVHGLKTMVVSPTDMRFTFAKRGTADIVAYSRRGVSEGRTGKMFLRLEADEKNLSWVADLKKIDEYTTKAFVAVLELLQVQWPDVFVLDEENKTYWPVGGLVCGSGYEAIKLEAAKSMTPTLTLCIFPNKWTRCYKLKTGDLNRQKSLLHHMVLITGNSNFMISLHYNTTQFSVDLETKVIRAYTYLNVGGLTFYDQGQDTNVANEMDEAEKEKIEARENAKALELFSKLTKPLEE